jgi:predicted nucleic acid-binding Zn ribbon protein
VSGERDGELGRGLSPELGSELGSDLYSDLSPELGHQLGRDLDRAGDAEEQGAGADAVRAALGRAKAAARERGALPAATTRGDPGRRRPRRGDDAWSSGSGSASTARSGARPDARDPQTLDAALTGLVTERGWQEAVSVGGVIGRWDAVVGTDVAAHCRPETFENGVLTVRADSTAWATQVRLLSPALLRRLADEVGEGTVSKVVVRGPSGPSWRRGPRVAPGSRGPGDTYG